MKSATQPHGDMAVLKVIWCLALCVGLSQCDSARHEVREFPEGFIFGVSTASYQVEGAWNEDGKTENIWDRLSHQTPCVIDNCDTGDVADNSYYLYKRDVEMLRELGVDFYRFSLSWARILPTGFPDVINEAGVQYYRNLIDELLKYNIEPMVTLFHWDLPQKLQDLGGFANPAIVDWFGDFAKVAFDLFGDKVKYWITMNEPFQICYEGYGSNGLAPMLNIKGYGEYLCTKNLLLAHARAYHIYNDEYRISEDRTIFISINIRWYEPESEEHTDAANSANEFYWMVYAHPIFSKTGDFPPNMKERIAAKSYEQGFYRSRLPEFTPEEVDYVRGTSDIFGLNHYSTSYVYRNSSVIGYHEVPSLWDDVEAINYQLDEWQLSETSSTKAVPWGFYSLLKSIKENYDNPPVLITENGLGGGPGLEDDDRITYYRLYLSAMLDAMDDGCNVIGYTAWSLMDNFEWTKGYSVRFGLYEVDYSTEERTRTARKSARMYRHLLRARALDAHYEPDLAEPMTVQ